MPFFELIRRRPTLRCADCHEMQLPQHPFIHPLCDTCRIDDKYRFVTAYTAKKNYFLDENDLLSLRTFSQKNPYYKHASHVRSFSRVDVQRLSELKLELIADDSERSAQEKRLEEPTSQRPLG